MEEEYKKEIENIKIKSEKILGKRIFSISTGGIVILAIIRIQIYRDFITPNQTTVFILAVVCFMLSLIINLYSNYDVAKRISNMLKSNRVPSREDIFDINENIQCMNLVPIIMICFGMFFSLCFFTI